MPNLAGGFERELKNPHPVSLSLMERDFTTCFSPLSMFGEGPGVRSVHTLMEQPPPH
jgi:hypothetical protein